MQELLWNTMFLRKTRKGTDIQILTFRNENNDNDKLFLSAYKIIRTVLYKERPFYIDCSYQFEDGIMPG